MESFFEVIKAGLWEKEVQVSSCAQLDIDEIYRLASEQSVIGLVAAGLEHVTNMKTPKTMALTIAKDVFKLEKRNRAMNMFVARLVADMRTEGIYALLVKGQGIAQCYERPEWRACGDVDLFLSEDNYVKAKEVLVPLASSVEEEYVREKHLGMTIDGWLVELHGHLYSGLSSRVEKELDDMSVDTFSGENVRSWDNNGVKVFQLGIENDVFYVFTHILQHFYKEGVGIRQICDWCRLMWTYRDKMDVQKLESRIKRAGIMSEWKAFAAYSAECLGMPVEAIPMYDASAKWVRKAELINRFILKVGNMGHNRNLSHFSKRPYLARKCVSMGRRVGDFINHARIFPLDSLRFFPNIMLNGIRSAMRGE